MSATEGGSQRPLVAHLSAELQTLQRHRAVVLKSRNMQANRLQAIVAGTIGYQGNLSDKERKKKFAEATALIKAIDSGKAEHPMATVVKVTMDGIKGFEALKTAIEKEMVKAAKQLPAAAWICAPEQRGFGLLFLAIVIGETGDLHNYANPAKVWKRLGCAPHTFDGQTHMGATWKAGKEGKLPKAEWEAFGYSPRRRSIAYLIGENIVKQNGAVKTKRSGETGPLRGPYRARYDEAKRLAAENHPEWVCCPKCEGKGKTTRGQSCPHCKGSGKVSKRCHLHGMLLATKLLLKNLWIEWNKPAIEQMQPR